MTDTTKVETDEERKARKEHESTSHVRGLDATLAAGSERDRVANVPPDVVPIKKLEAFIEEYKVKGPVIEDAPEKEAVVEEELEIVAVVDAPEEEATEEEPEKEEFDKEEAKALLAKLKDFLKSEE